MRIIPVAPTGVRVGGAFVSVGNECRYQLVELTVYPSNPRGEKLRGMRVAFGLSLGDAARLLGMHPVELSGIEHGRYTFEDEADFDRATSEFATAEPPKEGPRR